MGRELQTLNEQNKLALWAERISECRNSGQNVKTWCKENGICEQTYYKWQRRLFEIAQAQQKVSFAEVPPEQPVRSGSVAVTVRISGAEADMTYDALQADWVYDSAVPSEENFELWKRML